MSCCNQYKTDPSVASTAVAESSATTVAETSATAIATTAVAEASTAAAASQLDDQLFTLSGTFSKRDRIKFYQLN
jgi:hypothetical protein